MATKLQIFLIIFSIVCFIQESISQRRYCNLQIILRNRAGYDARLRFEYKLNGVSVIRHSNKVTFLFSTLVMIPFNAYNLRVSLQRNNGVEWLTFARDESIIPNFNCKKCFIVWNTVAAPEYDYCEA
jgi:hypothetical protein